MRTNVPAWAAAFILACFIPLILPAYYVNISSQVLIFSIFAVGLNILVGYAGLVSLGHASLFGLAAYAVGLLLGAGLGHFQAILFSLIACLIGVALFAVISLRAQGIGFMMITLALGQLLWGLAYRWVAITGGDNGIRLGLRPSILGFSLDDPAPFFLLTLVMCFLAVLACDVTIKSHFGASLIGTRDQPRRMSALGYQVWLIRFFACLLSGLLAGIAGILFVYYNRFINPEALTLGSSAEVLLMVISGGSGTLLGPVVGAALVIIVKTVVSGYVERWNLLLGVIFVFIMLFMPDGLVPGVTRLARRVLELRKRNLFSVNGQPHGSTYDQRP